MTRPLEKLALELQKATSPMELMGLLPDLAAGIYDLTQRLEKLEHQVAVLSPKGHIEPVEKA